jgi:predicted MFS family arabinose efflux permease
MDMTRRTALILAAGFIVLFIGGGARFGIGLTLKPSVDELGWGRGTLGATVAIFMIVSAVAMFVAGRMADRASPRRVLTAGLVLSGLGLGAMSAVSEAWEAILFYGIIFAIGQGLASVAPVGVLITRAFPGRTGLANAIAMSGMCAGQLVMMAAMASVLTEAGWRAVYVWLGLAHVLVLPIALLAFRQETGSATAPPLVQVPETSMRAAIRSRRFWVLLGLYALCGLDDFFVSTHVVAFAQDQGIDVLLSGHLLALMGLTGFAGVIAAGAWSDRSGPAWPALASFVLRILAFGLVLLDQSTLSVAIFALVFGATFLVTAPLTVIFVRDAFGQRNLGALVGLITMVHHICGGFGAWLGAALFDRQGSYTAAFAIMFASSVVALVLTQQMSRRGQTLRV